MAFEATLAARLALLNITDLASLRAYLTANPNGSETIGRVHLIELQAVDEADNESAFDPEPPAGPQEGPPANFVPIPR